MEDAKAAKEAALHDTQAAQAARKEAECGASEAKRAMAAAQAAREEAQRGAAEAARSQVDAEAARNVALVEKAEVERATQAALRAKDSELEVYADAAEQARRDKENAERLLREKEKAEIAEAQRQKEAQEQARLAQEEAARAKAEAAAVAAQQLAARGTRCLRDVLARALAFAHSLATHRGWLLVCGPPPSVCGCGSAPSLVTHFLRGACSSFLLGLCLQKHYTKRRCWLLKLRGGSRRL
eukprot:INCI13436.6.p1 GENE.INCI13436.6~~INCI13436.6.p1  ORF type:complete len:261 (-),score=62.76 INCI13436.6:290-1009(-)